MGQGVDGPSICRALQQTLEVRDSTVFIDGYGDTSNMLMSRLMLGNNEVIFGSAHFQNLDKVFQVSEDHPLWGPLDVFEPYRYLTPNNHERSKQGFFLWVWLLLGNRSGFHSER